MASVTDIYTTGDNDEPIYPEQYYKHYMYCDHCGSFEIKYWIPHENHLQIEKAEKILSRVITILAIAVVISIFLIVFPLFIILTLPALIGAVLWKALLTAQLEPKGVQCAQCKTTYPFGSAFFTDYKDNPRGFTMQDVPRPLYLVHQLRGDYIGPVNPETS